MHKINVVGTSGSGKSTFSRQLAQTLNYPYIEMDRLFWKADWQESSDDEFFAQIEEATQQPYWVLDGNYNRSREIKWKEVDTVIWVDYSRLRTLYQAVTRAVYRCLTQKELWPGTGNTESIVKSFFSRDSIILWTLKTYHSNRQRYLADMTNPRYQHIRFIRLTSPRHAKRFLQQLS
ncbi:(d)CMP kinase [Vibrio sp. Isolate25]|uniref:AAA family ATPase n=1 Tax=Vibrio TaxID=662 RepID=UPI001EFC6EDB|nr:MULTISPECIES: AAA family ATPase [Vibrio]MCG9596302.1 (d)CMP kinase [Vibrio sp. Isolate25]USD34813.1 (d)CMP kinase [Vibrio sp. SCSIO 43186]USD47878.1 (d)CMP kinase [Vibrio sp. SCSIO 43145]USD71936.1 (d)CMP kinase [Vibrio sp. SCSIO 43139]USD97601.1 adenylate kinase [Vibrio coralliilyticus]